MPRGKLAGRGPSVIRLPTESRGDWRVLAGGCMLISFILPTLCNLSVHWRQLSPLATGLNLLVVAMGVCGMVVGVQSTLSRVVV